MSLIEILVAMLIFTIIAVGIASATLTSNRTNRSSERKARAVNLAHQVLECAKSQYSVGLTVTGTGCNPTAPSTAGFTITGPIATPNPGGFPGMTQLQITVAWASPVPDRVTLDTLIDTQ